MVGEVRTGNDHGVAHRSIEQFSMVIETLQLCIKPNRYLCPIAAGCIRIGDCSHDGTIEVQQVGDVLNPHHAGANNAVTKRGSH